MKPSIGRTVLFKQPASEAAINGTRVHPAIITRVWSDACVNLHVFFDAVPSAVRTSVTLDGGFENPSWVWPERTS